MPEPAFHDLSDRALYDQRRFWLANEAMDAGGAFARACARELAARGLDPDTAPPPVRPEALRRALDDLLARASQTMVGSDRLAIVVTRRELYDLQALIEPVAAATESKEAELP